MLSPITFAKALAKLAENFNFTYKETYSEMIYDELKDKVSDAFMIETTKLILRVLTLEQWNQSYGYQGKPALADWLAFYIPPEKWKKVQKYRLDENGNKTGIFDWVMEKETDQKLLEVKHD